MEGLLLVLDKYSIQYCPCAYDPNRNLTLTSNRYYEQFYAQVVEAGGNMSKGGWSGGIDRIPCSSCVYICWNRTDARASDRLVMRRANQHWWAQ